MGPDGVDRQVQDGRYLSAVQSARQMTQDGELALAQRLDEPLPGNRARRWNDALRGVE
jgi:hypothetical protein